MTKLWVTIEMRSHPSTTHIDDWSIGWMIQEICEILHGDDESELGPDDFYLTMSDEQRSAKGWPVTVEEMRKFIKENGNEL